MNLGWESITNRGDDLPCRRENPQESQRTSVDDGLVIDEDLEFSVSAVYEVNVSS